jgi:hypothetical protein
MVIVHPLDGILGLDPMGQDEGGIAGVDDGIGSRSRPGGGISKRSCCVTEKRREQSDNEQQNNRSAGHCHGDLLPRFHHVPSTR